MLRTRLALAALILVGSDFEATAQDIPGEIVRPVGELPLRASPPNSFFQGKGQAIATVNPNEAYQVLGQQTVKTLAGSQDWIEIQPLDGSSGPGWAFSGPSGGPSNFITLE
jgi:hypothetical protein